MKRFLTCIICPMGCKLEVEMTDNKIDYIKGNTCPRGEKYATDECTNPVRTLTTTVRCENGEVIPVKTDRPIPKGKIFECMEAINSVTVHLPICEGDVIISDILKTSANIVAAKGIDK